MDAMGVMDALDRLGRPVWMASRVRPDQLDHKDQQDHKARKVMMDDQRMKLPFKLGSLVISPLGLKALLARQARKVSEAYKASADLKASKESAENAASQDQSASHRPLAGKLSLRAILTTLFKVCLWSLGIALAIVGLFVLYAILSPN